MKEIHIVSAIDSGLFTRLTEVLAQAAVNLESIDVEQVGDSSVMVITVDQYDLALQCLRDFKDIQVITEDAILVKLKDEPGALAHIARRFTDAGISLRSVRFIQRDNEYALVAISTDRSETALQLVADVSIF
ncbi:MAG: ACT domain-containing protein [Methylococcaceae bacterium]|nr:ACT domain-containing protein [Methylococcaceae bacterium]